MITIGIAEDQALFRKGIIGLLNSFEGFEVIVEAEHGQDLIDQYKILNDNGKDSPLITILDLRMPVLDGIKTTEILKNEIPESKIIVISSHNDQDIIVHLYDKGVNAFLDKNAEPEEVELAIKSVLQNDFYFNSAAKEALEKDISIEKVNLAPEDALTNREIDVLKLICQEKTTSEIAEELFISKKTVDNHRSNLIWKTEAKNMTGLVLFAIRSGILNVSELKINL